jgi:hypothetical protein
MLKANEAFIHHPSHLRMIKMMKQYKHVAINMKILNEIIL